MYSIQDVIRELIKMERETNKAEEKVYFSGEFDSHQTEFEEKSNHLEIGVLARSGIVGKACLRLVRYIIDNHGTVLFETDLNNTFRHFECNQPGIRRLIYYLAYTEEQYMHCYLPNDTFRVTLYKRDSEYVVESTISKVDIWTIDRLNRHYI